MNQTTCSLFALGLSLVFFSVIRADELSPETAEAVAQIKRLGGQVTVNEKAAGKPVTSVTFLIGIFVPGKGCPGSNLTDSGLEYLKAVPTVEELFLPHTKITDAGLIHLRGLRRLKYLDLGDTQITDAGLTNLQGLLPQLEVLRLYGTKVTDAGLRQLKESRQLKLLDLSGTKVTDAGLPCLTELPQLVALYLGDTEVGDAGLRHVKGLSHLGELALSNTRITDAGMEYVGGFKQLAGLLLDGTNVTDAGLKHLKGLDQLQSLSLSGTDVTDAGLESLRGLSRLQGLDLTETDVSDQAMKKFREALPACQTPGRGGEPLPPPALVAIEAPQAPSGPPCVSVKQIDDRRSTVPFFREFKLELEISNTPGKVGAFCCRVAKAIDDTGADLVREDNKPRFVFFSSLSLKQPARKATAIKEVSGVVEVFIPQRDPQATVEVTGFVGKPRWEISHPSLTAGGAQLTLVTKAELERIQKANRERRARNESDATAILGQLVSEVFSGMDARSDLTENSVIILPKDPNGRVMEFKFFKPSGEPIAPVSYVHDGAYYLYNFDHKLPETTVMRITVVTPKAVIAVPFTLKDIALP